MKPSLVGHICILKLYGPKWHPKLSLGSQICNLGVYGPKWHSRTSLRNGHVFYSFYKYDKRNRLHIRDSQPLHLEIIEIISGTDFFFLVILISVRNHCVHTLLSYVFLFLGTIFLYYLTSFCVTIGTLHDPVPEIYVWSQVCFYNYCSNVSYCMLPRHRHWQMPCDLSTQIFSSECIDLSRCPHVAASVGKELEHIDFICANMHCHVLQLIQLASYVFSPSLWLNWSLLMFLLGRPIWDSWW